MSVGPNEDEVPTANYRYFNQHFLELGPHVLILNVTSVSSSRAYDFPGFSISNSTIETSYYITQISAFRGEITVMS